MLRQRVLTAAVLIGLLLPVLALDPPWPFAIFVLVAFIVGAWEWARLNGAGALSLLLALTEADAAHFPVRARRHPRRVTAECRRVRATAGHIEAPDHDSGRQNDV